MPFLPASTDVFQRGLGVSELHRSATQTGSDHLPVVFTFAASRTAMFRAISRVERQHAVERQPSALASGQIGCTRRPGASHRVGSPIAVAAIGVGLQRGHEPIAIASLLSPPD